MRRVIPVVEAVKREVAVPLSVDTFKPAVARAAMEAGVDIINSISGFDDPELRRVARETGAAIVIMHIKGEPRVANPNPEYQDVTGEVRAFLEERVATCVREGIPVETHHRRPGAGFRQDDRAERHRDEGTPPFDGVAVSRSCWQSPANGSSGRCLAPPSTSGWKARLALVAWGVLQGVKLLRVHDVRASKRVAVMTEAVHAPGRRRGTGMNERRPIRSHGAGSGAQDRGRRGRGTARIGGKGAAR